jgi:beta-barrel assembly-enhancing protease
MLIKIIYLHMNYKYLFVFVLMSIMVFYQSSNLLFAQLLTYDFENYHPPIASGEIPLDFQISVEENYLKDIGKIDADINEDDKELQEEYYLKSHNVIHDILLSGRVLFNDPLSNYVNKVADNIKKNNPNKFDNIRIYIIKSPSVNASATGAGIVFINIGTLAYIKNEAQLAFILCHEFAHIVGNDNMEGFLEKKKLLKGKGIYGSASFDERIDALFLHDKNIEFKADSMAISYYNNCGYDLNEILKAFDVIHYSYLPFENIPFSKTIFNNGDFIVPSIFYKDKIDTISSVQDYKDNYHSHPNIYKRKCAIYRIIQNYDGNSTQKFFLGTNVLHTVRDIARFEVTRLHLLNKNYSDAIYSAYVLLQTYPENRFLFITIAKAVYGLAKYRNSDEYHLVTKSYSRVEGESQQVHYFFRQLRKVQLNVLALNYIHSLIYKYKDEVILKDMRKELVYDLVYYHGLSFDDFPNSPSTYSCSNIGSTENLTAAELSNAQKEVASFYLNTFCSEKDNETLKKLFEDAKTYSNKRKEEDNLSVKERDKLQENKEKEISKNGIECKNGKALIIDPILVYLDNEKKEDIIKSEKEKIDLEKHLREFLNESNINARLISSNSLDISDYNLMCSYKEMVQEILTKDICPVIPLCNDFSLIAEKNKIQIICIPVLYKSGGTWYYSMSFYDTQKKDIVYKNQDYISWLTSSSNKLTKLIKNDLLILNF